MWDYKLSETDKKITYYLQKNAFYFPGPGNTLEKWDVQRGGGQNEWGKLGNLLIRCTACHRSDEVRGWISQPFQNSSLMNMSTYFF